jgi:hypothetical protein
VSAESVKGGEWEGEEEVEGGGGGGLGGGEGVGGVGGVGGGGGGGFVVAAITGGGLGNQLAQVKFLESRLHGAFICTVKFTNIVSQVPWS